jgi:hypothetical protein
MHQGLAAVLRTAQTSFPQLLDAKFSLQRCYRNALGIPFGV